ncbi:hypothetical protein C8F01DRAFT_1088867 [Mycena amicta]|nr:hypothetical protein C8F01DRAFT_1088867 [Mycena amicta]
MSNKTGKPASTSSNPSKTGLSRPSQSQPPPRRPSSTANRAVATESVVPSTPVNTSLDSDSVSRPLPDFNSDSPWTQMEPTPGPPRHFPVAFTAFGGSTNAPDRNPFAPSETPIISLIREHTVEQELRSHNGAQVEGRDRAASGTSSGTARHENNTEEVESASALPSMTTFNSSRSSPDSQEPEPEFMSYDSSNHEIPPHLSSSDSVTAALRDRGRYRVRPVQDEEPPNMFQYAGRVLGIYLEPLRDSVVRHHGEYDAKFEYDPLINFGLNEGRLAHFTHEQQTLLRDIVRRHSIPLNNMLWNSVSEAVRDLLTVRSDGHIVAPVVSSSSPQGQYFRLESKLFSSLTPRGNMTNPSRWDRSLESVGRLYPLRDFSVPYQDLPYALYQEWVTFLVAQPVSVLLNLGGHQ